METPPEPTPPVRKKIPLWWWIAVTWPGGLLILYLLSYGPVLRLQSRGGISRTNEFVDEFYSPWVEIYQTKSLQKPLGLYLHLWVPEWFDKNGDWKLKTK